MDFQNLSLSELKYIRNKVFVQCEDLKTKIQRDKIKLRQKKICPSQHDGVLEAIQKKIKELERLKKHVELSNLERRIKNYGDLIKFLKKLEIQEKNSIDVTISYQFFQKESQIILKEGKLKLMEKNLNEVERIIKLKKNSIL